jgi:hypothetical protein
MKRMINGPYFHVIQYTLQERKGEYETDDQRSVVPYHPIHAAGEEGGMSGAGAVLR